MNYSNLKYKLLSAPLLIYLFSFPVSFVQSGVVRTKFNPEEKRDAVAGYMRE